MVKAKFDFAAISHRRFWSLWSTVTKGKGPFSATLSPTIIPIIADFGHAHKSIQFNLTITAHQKESWEQAGDPQRIFGILVYWFVPCLLNFALSCLPDFMCSCGAC